MLVSCGVGCLRVCVLPSCCCKKGSSVLILVLAALATGCSTLSPEARRVRLLEGDSVISHNCKNLGPIFVQRSFGFGLTIDEMLQEKAAKMGGDTVLEATYVGPGWFEPPSGHGIAMKCGR